MNIVSISASLRSASLNSKLLALASKIAVAAGNTVHTIDLREFPLPSYDGDIQNSSGIPEQALRLNEILGQSRILMIASPEYNYSIPGHFKNTFDWISRIRPMPWSGKIALFMSASPSLVGANRGLWSLRVPFESCGTTVYPEMISIPSAHEAFTEEGMLKEEKQQQRLAKTVEAYLEFAGRVAQTPSGM